MAFNTEVIYKMKFQMDNECDIPEESLQEWRKLKEICENGNNEDITHDWISKCIEIECINASFVNSMEGGISIKKNEKHRYCKYRYSLSDDQMNDGCIEIYCYLYLNECEYMKPLLNDLMSAFIKMASEKIGCENIKGIIKLLPL
jgi:hypothetical protein